LVENLAINDWKNTKLRRLARYFCDECEHLCVALFRARNRNSEGICFVLGLFIEYLRLEDFNKARRLPKMIKWVQSSWEYGIHLINDERNKILDALYEIKDFKTLVYNWELWN
ncbi:MAG: hypothetical protein MHMPM18_002840, partial [Marteilia pararefringens]